MNVGFENQFQFAHIFQKRKHIKGTLGYLSSVVLQRFDNKQTLQLDFQADIASLAMCIYTVLAEWSPTISRQKNTPLLQQRQEYIVQAQQVIHKKFTDNNFTNGIIRILDAVLADKPYTLEQLDRDYHALLQKVAPALADELYPLQNKENVQQAAPVSPMKSRRVPILGMPHNRFFALPALPPAEIRKRTANEALQDASPKRRTCQA